MNMTVAFIGSELVSYVSPYIDQVLNKHLFTECIRVGSSSFLRRTLNKTLNSMLSPLTCVAASLSGLY